ncbi:MAG: DUF362 domain-containing protein [Candidatus Aminicenantes bacterium]|nr:DUF362 domain-containing protein [Candidatus Aminicenantes bacterium]NIM79161.1 DUF362 domain-containing protein [Candidatus Aminicenantes bacterium]NIN18446.1 DUF362 domain-containing protein [Candidatus Aminicenantes bacterium]NIN42334.1 DUF362 domain-containing protein [Candidatus Aminicenantes bacterium]NIN85100.1 DUF362 domain-containing protein [Candidatus Aminicenantes bacterium]
MSKGTYRSINNEIDGKMRRREFLKIGGGAGMVLGSGLVLGTPHLWAEEAKKQVPPPRCKTNINDALNVPKTRYSLPGLFPGRVIEVHDAGAMTENKVNAAVIKKMMEKGITTLTSKNLKESFGLFFKKNDVVGLKVNPVGAGLINTRLEVVDAVIDWLRQGGIPAKNIIIWDRFDYMLKDAGFTAERYPGIGIEGLQTMDEEAATGKTKDNSRWLDKKGNHISQDNFDRDVYYQADVEGPKDLPYLNQHVFNGKYSYFGKLLTKKLTKIINLPVFKNSGNGISMATKNLGYSAVCNTGRLHKPIFYDVCVEVLAFPVIRDKLVLNITDGLRAQYDGGPMPNTQFTYLYNTMFFATDPFALDMLCHNLIVEKRRQMKVKGFNQHPRYTEYLRYAERLGLGITNPAKIKHIKG